MPSIDIETIQRALCTRALNDFPTFVETGTYLAETVTKMATHFSELFTIEVNKSLYSNAVAKYGSNQKIQFMLGDSTNVLKDILPCLKNNTIFFLDAHWSGGNTGKTDKDVPLIDELQCIMQLFTKEAILIIDDVRLFGTQDGVVSWHDISTEKVLDVVKPRMSRPELFLPSFCDVKDRLVVHLRSKYKTKIVTGASMNHFKSLLQFISTVRHMDADTCCLTVYDLGLDVPSLTKLHTYLAEHVKQSGYIVKKFKYEDYPAFMNIEVNAGEYAWKPQIIHEEAKDFTGTLYWMDAGNKILKPLANIEKIVQQDGIFTAVSSGKIKDLTHPLTFKYMNWTEDTSKLQCRAAYLVGFDCARDDIQEFILEWQKLAYVKDCIAPEGSSRLNHRQDQAILTLLFYKFFKMDAKTYTTFGEVSCHNDID